jgi:cathepsin B
MRSSILIFCLAILAFSALTSAKLRNLDAKSAIPDTTSATNTTVTNTTDTTNTTTNTTAVPSAADVTDFLSGVWGAIGLGHEFSDFSTCVPQSSNTGAQLQKAMAQLSSSSASDVVFGLNKMNNVISPLVAGLKACQMKDKYTTTINQIIKTFTNPGQLIVNIGSSIQIDGVEVYPEIAVAIAACNTSGYSDCGSSLGDAMGKAFYGQANATSANQVAQINSIPNITWTAATSTAFQGLTLWQFKKARVNLIRSNNITTSDNSTVDQEKRNLATIPASFDARTTWPTCIHPIRDQQGCGGCWAFAASEVLSDRFCIVSNKSINQVMSPQYLISCDTNEWGCSGGSTYYSWMFLENSGDVTDSCSPYKSGNGFVPTCSSFTKCADKTALRKYYAKKSSTKVFQTSTTIQNEIVANGPVETGMDVYSDFMSYASGVYATTAGATYLGGHAVKIVGWGSLNGVKYWIVANSWGTYWGESGYFRIQFGNCNIDSAAIAGIPDLTRS